MNTQIAYFGGGCFWCVEAVLEQLAGVSDVTAGYMGGAFKPTYEEVSRGDSGHVEVVQVTYDASVVTYEILLDVFFSTHNPTVLNRQGNDVGTQYRSVIFTVNEAQTSTAKAYMAMLEHKQIFDQPIVTTIEPAKVFYEAEADHQDYYRKNQEAGYCSAVISPKVAKLRQEFAPLLRENLLTKADFPQYDFEALKQAKQLRVVYTDGREKIYDVMNYWDMPQDQVDVVEGVDPSVATDAPEEERLPILFIPSPEIQEVHGVGAPVKGVNHVSHPENAFGTPTINKVFGKEDHPFRKMSHG